MSKKKKKNRSSTLPPMRPRAPTIAEFPAPPPSGSRLPSLKPPEPSSATVRDPFVIVREAIGELEFIDSAQTASTICCAALLLGLGARAAVVHATDSRTKTIRVIAARGAASESLAGTTASLEDDVVASTVTKSAAPMTLAIDPVVGLPRHAPERLKAMGAARLVLAVPALVMGRVVAIIEVVDPNESATASVEPSAQYAATQLARFLETRKKPR